MKKKIFLTICLIGFLISVIVPTQVYAGLLDDIISQGSGFGGNSTNLGNELDTFITGDIMPIVGVIGNLVFAAITVILGAKYIWSGAEGKSEVMESLPTFVVAVVFFYLGESLVNWLNNASSGITSATDWNQISSKVIWIINTVVHYAAFGGILVLGLRYMFASAEGKSNIKSNLGGVVIGIVFVFLASSVINFIIEIANGVI